MVVVSVIIYARNAVAPETTWKVTIPCYEMSTQYDDQKRVLVGPYSLVSVVPP